MQDKQIQLNQDVTSILKQMEQHLFALRQQSEKSSNDWLSVIEVADELKISRDTVDRLIASGKIKASAIRTSKSQRHRAIHRIKRAWVDDFLLNSIKKVSIEKNNQRRNRLEGVREFIK